MISIIICSKKPDISQKLKNNIAVTIGIEYELVVIDNSQNKHSIFSAYNEGVRRSRYPYLCFMHEDVLYHTKKWGLKIIEHFERETTGLIGIVGTHFMPKVPCGWYHSMMVSGGCLQRQISNDANSNKEKRELKWMESKKTIDAVAVDGMWFCIRKELFGLIRFDDLNFNGFHCYDLDICLQIRQCGFEVEVISDILIEHFSYGSFDIEWIKATEIFFNKWQKALPQVAGVELSEQEIEIRTQFVKQVMVWITAYAYSQEEMKNIRKSKAYKIGKFLLKPFSLIKNK